MKITVLAIGTRGDTQPYVALAAGLQRRGHEVRVVCAGRYRDLPEAEGLETIPLTYDPVEVLRSPDGQRMIGSGRNSFQMARMARRIASTSIERDTRELHEAVKGSDAIVYSVLGFSAYHVAEQDGIWSCSAPLQPEAPTRRFQNMVVPFPLGGLGNLLSHHVARQILWQFFRDFINDWRTKELGIRPLPLLGPYPEMARTNYPVLNGYSEVVLPRPDDWPSNTKVTGYWFLDEPAGWTPPAELTAFLDAGPTPVYVGFGSMIPGDPARTHQLIRAALRKAGLRGVVQGDPATMPSDDQVHVVSDVPHSWLFPRMAAVAHHGGAGTTAAGLRAGAPTVICAFFSDQPFWGDRVRALGAGPRHIMFKKLTPDRLAAALRTAVTDPSIREHAADLGRRIRAEDGVAVACDLIESWANSPARVG